MKRLLTLLVAVVSATGLRAEGYQVNNLSTRQTGMGHVGTAMKLNSESIFFNPAATAFQDSKFDLSVGAAGILSYCTYTPSPTMENGFYSGNRPEWESDNEMSTPIYAYFNYKPSDRWAVGLGFFTPNGSSMNWGDDWPGANLVQEINLAAYTVQPTVSFKLCDRVSIGAGLMITWGNFDLSRSMLPVATGSATAAGGLQLAASKLQAQVDQLEQLPSTPEIAAQIAALNGYIGQANAGAGYFAANHAGEALVSARLEGSADVAVGVNAANKAGLRSSVDLIYGAPGESLDDWRTSVTTAIDLGVNHISAYALTVEPTTKMGRQIAAGTLPKPNDDDEAAKYEIADDLFAAAGLEWYEVSNWARPGYESQHNLGYWRNVDWAGLGPGAHSHYNAVTEADHPQSASLTAPAGGSCPADAGLGVVSVSHGLRSWDIAHPRLWGTAINENRVPWADSETITPEENLEELIMLGLRLHEGLDLDRINRAINNAGMSSTPQTLRNVSLDQLAPMVSEGLITVSDNHRVVPTRRGRLLNDSVIEQFFDFVGV